MSILDTFRASLKTTRAAVHAMDYAPSDELRDFLAGTVALVEATNFEKFSLWQHYNRLCDWQSNPSGFGVLIGELDDRSIVISVLRANIDGKQFVFWFPTSEVVDYAQIKNWLDFWIPDSKRMDAQNFSPSL